MPFAVIGALVAWRLWHELPPATRKYIEAVESKPVPVLAQAEAIR